MTTIAYRDGVLAADRMESVGDVRLPSKATKVHRLRDGRLFAWTGDHGVGIKLRQHLNDPKRIAAPDTSDKGCAIIVDTRGRVWTYESNALAREFAPYVARGSGLSFALGAFAMGASAKQAVVVAGKFDKSTGRGVKALKVQPKR